MSSDDKQTVIRAINKLGRRITVADVATATGLSLFQSNRLLNEVAADVGGHLEVTEHGLIAYRFRPGFQAAYLTTGIAALGEKVYSVIVNLCFFVVKISFGIILLGSLAVVMAAVMLTVFVTTFGMETKNKRRPAVDLTILRDLILWHTPNPLKRPAGQSLRSSVAELKKNNFLINCFSFLFGDQNPNQHIEERQWQLIAQLIHDNSGVVTAEQLAPLILDDKAITLDRLQNLENEDFVLPILFRYEGKPEVSETGSLLYVFPDLQTTTAPTAISGISLENSLGETIETTPETEFETTNPNVPDPDPEFSGPKVLIEEEIPFSNLTKEQLGPVLAVATINLAGTWWLAFATHSLLHIYRWQADVLVIYGTLFVIIPLLRWCYLHWVNAGIIIRNTEREKLAKQLIEPDKMLSAKLTERAEVSRAQETPDAESDPVVYTTEKNNLDQPN